MARNAGAGSRENRQNHPNHQAHIMNTITMATFNQRSQAESLRKQLEEAHIPAVIYEESPLRRLWFLARPNPCVRVKVPASMFEDALRLLQLWDTSDGVLRSALHCPECRSTRVEYPQFTRKFFLPNLLGILSVFGLLERKFYCENCQYMWAKRGAKPSRLRPNMAPDYFMEDVPHSHGAPNPNPKQQLVPPAGGTTPAPGGLKKSADR
jgi:hypothetical protein